MELLYRFPIRSGMTNNYCKCLSIIDWIPSGACPRVSSGEGMTNKTTKNESRTLNDKSQEGLGNV